MNGARAALDTSIAVAILRSEKRCVERFRAEPLVALPTIVAGELLFGALNSGLQARNYTRYEAFIDGALLLCVDRDTARHYAQLRLALKRAGRPIPENDIWIAALCLQHGLVLVTSDGHFADCPGLVTENWLVGEPEEPAGGAQTASEA